MALYAVILAGGSGTRFWPLSRVNIPKQFLVLQGTASLLQATVSRLAVLLPPEHIYVVTAAHQQAQTSSQLPQLPATHILSEPVGRNTAAAIGLAAWHLSMQDPEAMLVVLPADHAIADSAAFCTSLQQAVDAAAQADVLMTLGVQPTYPATGYGYIQVGASLGLAGVPLACQVTQFMEKPVRQTAEEFLAAGNYLWNCGIFVWRAATIMAELRTHMPELAQRLDAYMAAVQAGAPFALLQEAYRQLPSLPIDIGVLEKSTRVGVLPVTWDWSDVGSWGALADLHPQDAFGNVAVGTHISRNTQNVVVYSPDRLVATIGVSDLIIVQTNDVLLICAKDCDQEVRDIVQRLQQDGRTDVL